MDITTVLHFVQTQPWFVAVPLVALAFVDGLLGAAAANKRGEKFSWQRFDDFMRTSVGAHQVALIAGSVAVVFLTRGSHEGWLALGPLVMTSGPAYLSVLADVLDKARYLAGPPASETAKPQGIRPV